MQIATKNTPAQCRRLCIYKLYDIVMKMSSDPSENFPERLRSARELRRLNQAELAERAGLQPSAVSHFETGRRAPSFQNLKRLADALGVTIDFLLGRTEEPKTSSPLAEQLFRDFAQMSQEDQEDLAKFARLLAEKNEQRAGGKLDVHGRTRYQEAARQAEVLIEELAITKLPVDPFLIAAREQIVVQPKDSNTPGVSGFLMRMGNTFGIKYATHIKNEGFIRFTVAHELGHYFLPGHSEHLFPNGQGLHPSRSGFISSDPYELEADHFAASLLMPSKFFMKALRTAGEGFEAVEVLAALCKTSITATAIRFATYAEAPLAVIVSAKDRIDYCFMSRALREIRGMRWIRKGDPVPLGTVTRSFNRQPRNIEMALKDEGWTGLDLWFDGAPEVEMKEDVVGLGSYGKTLTVLFTDAVDKVTDKREEHNEDGLEELDGRLRWKQRRH